MWGEEEEEDSDRYCIVFSTNDEGHYEWWGATVNWESERERETESDVERRENQSFQEEEGDQILYKINLKVERPVPTFDHQ